MRPSLRERFAAPRGKRLTSILSLPSAKRVRRNRQGTARAEANTAQTSDELPKRNWRTALVHKQRVKTPNDPKLSDGGVRRGTCMVGGKAAAEAGAVTHGAVRCSAWLGVGVRIRTDPMQHPLSGFRTRFASPKACVGSETECVQAFENGSPLREASA